MHTSAYRIRYVRIQSHDILDQYTKRAHDTITNTPIIHIGAQSGKILTIYVENLSENIQFSQLQQRCFQQKFYLLQSAIIGFMNLKKKYGCFKIDENLMKINQNGKLKVWIHHDPVKMTREFPLPEESKSQSFMVHGIIQSFSKIIPILSQLDASKNLQQLLMSIHKLMPKQLSNTSSKVQQKQLGQKKQIGKYLQQKFQTAHKIRSVRRSEDPSSQIIHFTPIIRKKSVRFQNKQYQPSSSDNIFQNFSNNIVKPEITNTVINNRSDNKRFLQQTQHPIKIDKPYPNFLNHKIMSQSQFNINNPEIHFENFEKKVIKQAKFSEVLDLEHQVIPGSMIAQQTKQDLNEKQRLFQRSKFPYSTESTLVSLKQTKSFGDIPPFNDFQLNVPVIQQEKSSQNKESSKGRSNVFTSQNDIEAQLDNLFVGDVQSATDEKQYEQRQLQFEEILFS